MTTIRNEQDILNDVSKRCNEFNPRISFTMMYGNWERVGDEYEYNIENYLYYRTYTITNSYMHYLCRINEITYQDQIDHIASYLAYDSSESGSQLSKSINTIIQATNDIFSCEKENNEMFKKLSDTDYENAVAAITDEYEDKKRDAKAEYNEKLAKAEAEKVTANIREEADLWAYDLYARYNALHESGFAEELSIELLKLYISSKK